jgi:hypothetical protein
MIGNVRPGDQQLDDAIFQESLKTAWGTLLLTPLHFYWEWMNRAIAARM